MKIVIFAGGVGTRLWPLSRKNTPKQFEKIIGDKSTLQQSVERVLSIFPANDIYIATGKRYEQVVQKQLPKISKDHFIFEPEMRDVGPAIGLVAALLEKKFPNEAVAILWSDHVVKNYEAFKKILLLAERTVIAKKAHFVFISQKPRFANQNMGWIEVGSVFEEKDGVSILPFKKLFYRPKLSEATSFFESKHFAWNLGYFVTTPQYLCSLFKMHTPSLYAKLEEIASVYQTDTFDQKLQTIYPKLEKISFDDAILTHMNPDNIFVISADLGWSDVGAWESLKEALAQTPDENVIKGKVMLEESTDSLVFNYSDALVVGIDLDKMLVVNTGDVLLVCPKTSVPKIKKIVESLLGTPHEHLA